MKKTQGEKLLELLKTRAAIGVRVYEMTMPKSLGGLGISQYNARIKELREAGWNIFNKEPGHFVLLGYGKSAPEIMAEPEQTPEETGHQLREKLSHLKAKRSGLRKLLNEKRESFYEQELKKVDMQIRVLEMGEYLSRGGGDIEAVPLDKYLPRKEQ